MSHTIGYEKLSDLSCTVAHLFKEIYEIALELRPEQALPRAL
jgi:hypothetical protein